MVTKPFTIMAKVELIGLLNNESILRHSLWATIAFLKIYAMIKADITTTIIMYGKMTHKVIATEIVLKKVIVAIPLIIGIIMSMVAISFENLVKILPIGFESKKRMFDLTSLWTISWCMFELLVL
jgi:hypothetical protein